MDVDCMPGTITKQKTCKFCPPKGKHCCVVYESALYLCSPGFQLSCSPLLVLRSWVNFIYTLFSVSSSLRSGYSPSHERLIRTIKWDDGNKALTYRSHSLGLLLLLLINMNKVRMSHVSHSCSILPCYIFITFMSVLSIPCFSTRDINLFCFM